MIDPATGIYLGQQAVGTIAGSGSIAQTAKLWIGYNTIAPGDYYVGAVADATNANLETDETNNVTVSGSAITLSRNIDLAVLVTAPVSAGAGSVASVDYTVTNQGTTGANVSKADIYLSTDTAIDATDVYLGQVSCGLLAPGGTCSGAANVTIPANTNQGQYYIGVIADSTNTNTEANETNNAAASAAMTVGPAALSISPASAFAAGCYGDAVVFTASGGTGSYTWAWDTTQLPAPQPWEYAADLTVLNATQARWFDDADYFCGPSASVPVTVTDSLGASATANLPVN
ncbi:MAG: hypothetical protein HY894_09500 [Deltaproteobacteria bacterium]|nr:hypothetical protein [Deltaproteobacteria bacterium]